ncbi:hypothetical protein K6119_16660 [Paracrocinitomix mangrovi]|uniref:hypothetical protein n=1 Tax=Paracrocinitomix mangrovi TaxID=2862509 RepID=UPI001C8D220B|nr:hypothetical protein [Paracrocinitomix mangrovi]UKN01360.1 hypothetical protein K6119_16660 [Paracrocinitomix mangrovi]
MKKRHEQKLVVLALALFIGLNVPFILIFDFQGHVLGIPVLYLYIFFVWLVSILIAYRILSRFYE